MPFVAVVYVSTAEQWRRLKAVVDDADVGRMAGLYPMGKRDEPTCNGSCTPKNPGWGRDPKMGHLVHGPCKRRHRDWRRRIAVTLMDTFGINLMPRDETPTLFRNPKGWDWKRR